MNWSNPRKIIDSISKFESSDKKDIEFDVTFLKNKLVQATENRNIINLLRGEGRKEHLISLFVHPELAFDWGIKSQHAYLDEKNKAIRDLLDPNRMNRELLLSQFCLYVNYLKKHLDKYKNLRPNGNEMHNLNLMEQTINTTEDKKHLFLLKDWLIYALHTMGWKPFSNFSSCISCACGNSRFEIANKFGSNKGKNSTYVLLDSWVDIHDEGITFRRPCYVNEQLQKYGLTWFDDINSEIMLRYAIFPQKLVGYYLIEDGEITKYVFNRHYLSQWEKNETFQIGDYVYIDQNVDFTKYMPYKTIYQYYNGEFDICARQP